MQTTTRMRVEYLEAPLGLDEPVPRMSWAPVESARGAAMASFQIVVKSAGTTVWDSGVVASNSSLNVAYGGPPLTADTDYTWTLVWTDAQGASAPASTAPAAPELTPATAALAPAAQTATAALAPAEQTSASPAEDERWTWSESDGWRRARPGN